TRCSPESQPASGQAHEFLHLHSGVVEVSKDATRQRKKRLARSRERDVATGAVEQRRSELPLESGDLPAERGLRDSYGLSSPGEVSGLGNRSEVLELVDLHAIAYGYRDETHDVLDVLPS